MSSAAPSLFSELFEGKPDLVRNFLHSALQLRDLQQLYAAARQSGSDYLSQSVLKLLDISLQVTDRDLGRIPRSGAVLIVANHPFGLLDGLLLDALLMRVRPDVKILTNSILSNIEELRERCLPIDVFGHAKHNVGSLRRVLAHLREGHGVAFFPAGEVSHWQTRRRCITDPDWSSVAIRCATAANAPIVPMFFAGTNSLSFQIAGLIHPRLRTARLPGELINKRGRQAEVRIGSAISASELARFESAEQATQYVRARTYTLEHRSREVIAAKSVFELPLMKRAPVPSTAAYTQGIATELAQLQAESMPVLETPEFLVFSRRGDRIPRLLSEIGRLREITFRAVGEGSGKALDLDEFDRYYTHLILWSKTEACIAGGYRLAWTDDVLPAKGMRGLYTSTLFRYHPLFFQHLGPAVELGRSFVRQEFQKDYAPLMLLWQAIARLIANRPHAPVLFGPVSISAEYSEAARELIVRFVSEHSFRHDLAQLVIPRHPFHSRLTSSSDLRIVGRCLDDIEALAGPLSDIAQTSGVPVLLRQYLKLGGRVAGFNVDRKFSNALDGLLIVDLRETAPKMLARYMGREVSLRFLKQVGTPRAS